MEQKLIDSFDRVYIHTSAIESSVAQNAYKLFDSSKIEVVESKPLQNLDGKISATDFSSSKRLLYLTDYKGEFFKRCPGAKPGLTCCNYFVLNLGIQCNMNCSYCYLQSYINSPLLTVYTNIEKALAELKTIAVESPEKYFRVGTGETTDSLSLDDLTLYSRRLIEFFRDLPKWKLEFKTKSSKVDQFLDVEHAGNVICSWSVNPQNIIEKEEHLTASLEQRLSAARKCRDKGFTIAFHFDPMIYHSDWRENYGKLIEQITTQFRPEEVIYITVGALRYQPEQRVMMRERFGSKSLATAGEMFTSTDGKMRYDQSIRTEMFDFIQKKFKEKSLQTTSNPTTKQASWRVSLCMEVPETWSMTMASSPSKIPELRELFKPS